MQYTRETWRIPVRSESLVINAHAGFLLIYSTGVNIFADFPDVWVKNSRFRQVVALVAFVFCFVLNFCDSFYTENCHFSLFVPIFCSQIKGTDYGK